MTLLDHDLAWLNAEAGADPASAQRIVEALAARVQTLQRQADELRAENALLKRGGQQVSGDQVQRLKTNLRDLRQVAARAGLDRDVVSLLTFAGHGVQLPAPAPLEQSFPLLTDLAEPVGLLKPLYLAAGQRFGSLLAITSALRLALLHGLGVPLSETLDWRDARPLPALGLGRAERVEALYALDELAPPRDILLVTRQGWVRAISWSHTEALTLSGQSITLPGMGDVPVWLGASDAEGDLLLLTRNGRWTRFPIGLIPATGCAGITLDGEDDVVSALVIGKREVAGAVWFMGADGALFAVAAEGLEAHKKPGGKAAPLTRRFMGLACFAVSARKTDTALLLTHQGDFHVVSMQGLPLAARLPDVQPLHVAGQRVIAATLL
jgi:hypothetical protein